MCGNFLNKPGDTFEFSSIEVLNSRIQNEINASNYRQPYDLKQ